MATAKLPKLEPKAVAHAIAIAGITQALALIETVDRLKSVPELVAALTPAAAGSTSPQAGQTVRR